MEYLSPKRIKIATSLLIAFVAALTLNNTVFYANSPNINPLFIANLKSIPSSIVSAPNRMIAAANNLIFPPLTNENSGTGQMSQQNVIFPQPTQVSQPLVTVQPTAVPQPTVVPSDNYKLITTGVYAAEDPVTKTTTIKIDAGVKVEEKTLTYTQSDGTKTTIKLLIPVVQ